MRKDLEKSKQLKGFMTEQNGNDSFQSYGLRPRIL